MIDKLKNMFSKQKEKNYRIWITHPREMTLGEDLKIDILVKLTNKEKELLNRQQLQLNEQKMMEDGGAKTISYTHMIEHVINPTDIEFEEKIIVNTEIETDGIILKKWMEQLLSETEKHILYNKK